MKFTERDKQVWNAAVKATVREVVKYDGIMTEKRDRDYLAEKVTERVSYKIPERTEPVTP